MCQHERRGKDQKQKPKKSKIKNANITRASHESKGISKTFTINRLPMIHEPRLLPVCGYLSRNSAKESWPGRKGEDGYRKLSGCGGGGEAAYRKLDCDGSKGGASTAVRGKVDVEPVIGTGCVG